MTADRDPSERRRHGATFADPAVTGAYAARPSYPVEVVGFLTRDAAGPLDVLDLGAGTGRLTELLARPGHRVTAVDPSAAMLAALRRSLPEVAVVQAGAEEVPLDSGSVDVVTVAQAFHWFDPELALAEIARLLRPGGTLGVVYNVRDERSTVGREMTEVFGGERARTESAAALRSTARFDAVEEATYAVAQRLDRAGLAALARSRSYVALMPDDERQALLAALEDVFDRHAVDGRVTVPYVTRCWRARRTDRASS